MVCRPPGVVKATDTCEDRDGGSMARIPLVTRDQIVEKEKPAYDAFMQSRANRPNIGRLGLGSDLQRRLGHWTWVERSQTVV